MNKLILKGKYNPFHSDFDKEEYFPTSDLLSYNQMIDVLDNLWVTLAACVLTDQFYLITYGEDESKLIQEVNLEDDTEELLKVLEQEELVTCFSICGKPFGTKVIAWDIYRKIISGNRSESPDWLAELIGVNEGNSFVDYLDTFFKEPR